MFLSFLLSGLTFFIITAIWRRIISTLGVSLDHFLFVLSLTDVTSLFFIMIGWVELLQQVLLDAHLPLQLNFAHFPWAQGDVTHLNTFWLGRVVDLPAVLHFLRANVMLCFYFSHESMELSSAQWWVLLCMLVLVHLLLHVFRLLLLGVFSVPNEVKL